MMRKVLITILILGTLVLSAEDYHLKSPDGNLQASVRIDDGITFSLSKGEVELLRDCPISMTLEGQVLGLKPRVRSVQRSSIDSRVEPVIKVKSAEIRDLCNEMEIFLKGNYSLVFRAYDQGIAYRWKTGFESPLTILNEEFSLRFTGDHKTWFPEEESMFTHQERVYLDVMLSEIGTSRFSSVPLLVDLEDEGKLLITEADLYDYPGMYMAGSDEASFTLSAIFPYYPFNTEKTSDRDVKVVERENFMAETAGRRAFPWRVMIWADEDRQLLENQMVYLLSRPLELTHTEWIHPGKVAWDWWNANNIYHVDFEAGINTETYMYYIDFASEYGIEYIIMDEGWYELGDLFKVNPEIDMKQLTAYAGEKGVGIILWVVWKTLDDQLEEALDQFEDWGIRGIKVDFMQRDDQWMVNYYWRIAEKAAEHRLLVDFHGSYKPAGLRRAWPNVLTREGVRGLEWSKWSDGASPEMAVTLPYIRMVAGPMDYTPGAMINATQTQFYPVFDKPMSQGTRCHQLAMYVVFESPLQMLADAPTRYLVENECMDFLANVPTVWDETIPLDGTVGEYVVIARRAGEKWFLAAMTNWEERDLDIDMTFLGDLNYTMTSWADGMNAQRNAEDFKVERRTGKTRSGSYRVHLAPGGGFVAIIE